MPKLLWRLYAGIEMAPICRNFTVLGAGAGWAKSILFNAHLAEQFSAFFQRSDTFGLGIFKPPNLPK